MRTRHYDRERATQLLPLLRSIVREIRERSTKAAHVEAELAELGTDRKSRFLQPARIQELRENLGFEERALRRVVRELHGLGCSIEPAGPLTIRITGSTDRPHHAYTWRAGSSFIELAPVELGARAA